MPPRTPPHVRGEASVGRQLPRQPGAKVLADVYRLRPGESRWTRVGRLPTARNYARTAVYRGGIYVLGGSTTFGDSHGAAGSTVVERYVP